MQAVVKSRAEPGLWLEEVPALAASARLAGFRKEHPLDDSLTSDQRPSLLIRADS